MRFIRQTETGVHAECLSCKSVHKVPIGRLKASGPLWAIEPSVVCSCGTVSNMIDHPPLVVAEAASRTIADNASAIAGAVALFAILATMWLAWSTCAGSFQSRSETTPEKEPNVTLQQGR
jgi:hypothetical protein